MHSLFYGLIICPNSRADLSSAVNLGDARQKLGAWCTKTIRQAVAATPMFCALNIAAGLQYIYTPGNSSKRAADALTIWDDARAVGGVCVRSSAPHQMCEAAAHQRWGEPLHTHIAHSRATATRSCRQWTANRARAFVVYGASCVVHTDD